MKDTSWGKVAGWYDDLLEEGDGTYQSKVILPNLSRLLAVQSGERILDLACGQGFFSRAFASFGAEVTGADISKELISKAEEKNTAKQKIKYIVSPAHNLSMLSPDSFDKITIVLALQNIDKLKETLEESRRLLKKNGKLLMVLNHPAFRIPKRTSWGYDEKMDIQYRRIDGYLSDSRSEIVMNPGKDESAKTLSFHRPLQSYFKHLSKSGFAILRLEEWNSHKKSEPGKKAKSEDLARKEIPMFLYIEAVAL